MYDLATNFNDNDEDLINDITPFGWNALHFSCYLGYIEIV